MDNDKAVKMTFWDKLSDIQFRLKAPKSQYNKFGKYNYRNCEDILEAVKPLLNEHHLYINISDSVEIVGNRFYIKAAVIVSDGTTSVMSCAYAREEESKKGMDGSQVTGASSSYARKYALNGMFAIDDTKDSDTTNQQSKGTKPEEFCCEKCGTPFKPFTDDSGQKWTSEAVYNSVIQRYGKPICKNCREGMK